MLLKSEIEKLRDSLFTKCSEKEKLFYHFVTKQPYTETLEMPTGDLDKICFAVFTNNGLDVSKEVQRVAPLEPFKHIHYSNSIITLIPVCLKSNEAKNKHLKSYFDSHSLAEKFLLTKIFASENFQFIANSITELDKLMDETFFHPQIANALQHLPSAFLEVNDVVGLLAFREAYLELLKIHPNTKIENQFSELSNEISKLISVVTKRIDIAVDIITVLFFLCASPYAVYKINQNYDALHIDKLSSIWSFVSWIPLVFLFLGKKWFPSVFTFYDDVKHRLVALWFWFHRVNYSKLSTLCKKD